MRLFTAVRLSKSLLKDATVLLEKAPRTSKVKWVRPQDAHVTLRFLGDYEEAWLPALREALRESMFGLQSFEMSCWGIGAFPDLQKPRVLFMPVEKGRPELGRWAEAISKRLKARDLPFDAKPFQAHVTLGRVKEGQKVEEIVESLRRTDFSRWSTLWVDGFELIESQLTQEGPVYKTLEVFNLG